MNHEVIVPHAGESITEVFLGRWRKKSGDWVEKDEVLVDLETQKTSFELQAEVSGRIEILFPEPETKVKPGDVIAHIEDSAEKPKASEGAPPKEDRSPPVQAAAPKAPAKAEPLAPKASPPPEPSPPPSEEPMLSPAARKIAAEKNLDTTNLKGSGKGGRVMKEDVADLPPREKAAPAPESRVPSTCSSESPASPKPYRLNENRGERREAASRIRRTIAQNLVAAQHTAAILTTFNEADMSQVMEFRQKHKEAFKEKHGVSLSLMSFFARAAVRALKTFPIVNSYFTGEDVIHRDFIDLSIAVSTESGLVVPVIRDVDQMSLEDFEKTLSDLSERARSKKISVEEMTGGTFTISNGGVFGSLLSTPILNMPQSAILGLHKIQDRPVVVNGEILIRPVMYLALSYDHRLIDGREAVSFLVNIKEGVENLYHIIREEDL